MASSPPGLDTPWEAASIYASARVRQILDGRHIYRCIEAHTVTLTASCTLYILLAFSDKEINELMRQIKPAVNASQSYRDEQKTNSDQFKVRCSEFYLKIMSVLS